MGGKTLFLNCLESILISVCPRGCDSQPRWRGPCQQKQCAVCIPNAVCCIPTDVMKGFITCRILQCVSGHFRAEVLKLRKGSDLNGTRTVLQHGRLRLESNDVALAHEYQGRRQHAVPASLRQLHVVRVKGLGFRADFPMQRVPQAFLQVERERGRWGLGSCANFINLQATCH